MILCYFYFVLYICDVCYDYLSWLFFFFLIMIFAKALQVNGTLFFLRKMLFKRDCTVQIVMSLSPLPFLNEGISQDYFSK